MSDIKDLTNEITKHLQTKKAFFDSVRYGRSSKDKLHQKPSELTESASTKDTLHAKSKSEIYTELKDQFKFSWKSPGYCNAEFSQVPVLKAKVLSGWDRERALMPERSYKAPKDYKGMKVTYKYEEFGETSESLLPKIYRERLDNVRKDHLDRVLRPSKYGPLKEDIKMANLFNNEKERGWKRSNTAQYKAFGFDRKATYKSEQIIKKRTQSAIRL